jgi:uncharacterized protein (UPF0333 family)
MQDQKGQAVLEYLLMISVAITMVIVINTGFRRIVNFIWQQVSCEVAAACPDCPPPPDVRNKISHACR